jgi:putative glutamine amidotransferase
MGEDPRIAITTYGRDERGRFSLPAAYVDCVRRAGGLAVLLAPGEPRLAEWLALADALILVGGGDLDPALYGGPRHPALYGVDRERDEGELALARRAVQSLVPTLGICRGTQVINVALGGTLHVHLPDVVGEGVAHRGKGPGEDALHAVEVEPSSRLARVLGATRIEPASSHHQAIRDVAPGLVVTARASDGTIEAVEMPEHPWLVAVQWHPESTAAQDATQQRLFDAVVRAAREARSRRGERIAT